jgi:DNA-binding NarL/FixJ family response regulator
MKILIVDDHALFREGLCHVLNAYDEEVSIVEASDYDHALQHVSDNPDLDMILLDLNMPGKDGFVTLESFTKLYPALPVVIISASILQSNVQRALDAGAVGYIPKDTTSAVMLSALRLILSGGIYVPQGLLNSQGNSVDVNGSNESSLTARQVEVLNLIVQGCSNKEIASKMDVAEATVKMHVTAILKSLGVNNRTQAAMAAEKLGLVTSSG